MTHYCVLTNSKNLVMREKPLNFQELSRGHKRQPGIVYIRRIPPDDKLDLTADRKLNIFKEKGFSNV